MKKCNISQLAEITGFSKSTISRVLSGKSDTQRISQQTKQQITEAAQAHGCVVRSYGKNHERQVRNNTCKTIGVIVPHISNPFFAALVSSIIREAQKYNISTLLFDSLESPDLERSTLKRLQKSSVDGIIIVTCSSNVSDISQFRTKPMLLVDRYFKSTTLPYIATNNFDGGYQAITQLIKAGHRDILCVMGVNTSITTAERKRGCIKAVNDSGVHCQMHYRGNEFSVENGYAETRLALSLHPEVTAIFAMSCNILQGCLQALNDLKLSVPENISIISFDDNQFLDYLNPPITRIAQPVDAIGRTSVKVMYESITEGREMVSQVLMSPHLVTRNSIQNKPITK